MKLLNLILIFVFVELIITESVWGLSPPIRDPVVESPNENSQSSVSADVAHEVDTKNNTPKVAASMGGGGMSFSPDEEDGEPINTYNPRNPYGAGWCCRTASQAYYDSRCRTDLNYYYSCIPTTYYANQHRPPYNFYNHHPGYNYYGPQHPGYNYYGQQEPGSNFNGEPQPLYSPTRPKQTP
uniref:Uncharacterized protein n=1 Tax=Panagrolaimus sp. JU765 TaxID=591449 RepID=A0AC34RBI4_9BILA